MKAIYDLAIKKEERKGELYIEVAVKDFKSACVNLYDNKRALLRVMFASDERPADGSFRLYAAFTIPSDSRLFVITAPIPESGPLEFPSITMDIPSAHWYEREISDMLGITPVGHPDARRLIFHESFPASRHPLRRDFSITADELRQWGEGMIINSPHEFMRVGGEGVCEIPVGPVHAGIIEPGHFRFSAVGETIVFLEPRLFYKHKGTERHFVNIGFERGVELAERVSGTSSFAHSAAYCMAVEKMMGIEISRKAAAIRTLLMELERLYNHIGDIGNLCAGTALSVGYARGALIKETLLQLNARLTGSRFLRGINTPGGVKRDILENADDILKTLDAVTADYKDMMRMLLSSISHVERLEDTGRLSKDIAMKLGATGVTARSSGITDDLRKSLPHLIYDRLIFESHTREKGDVMARMMVRAEEADCSISLMDSILEGGYTGDLVASKPERPGPLSCGFGYAESPRGSVFYFVKADNEGLPLRVKMRSPSYCNWPVVPYAVHGNIVPDFPLCNKSFNLSYSGCDM